MTSANFNILPKASFEAFQPLEANKSVSSTHLANLCDLVKKTTRIAWDIFSVVVFPIGLVRLAIKSIAPLIVLPALNRFNLDSKQAALNALKSYQPNRKLNLENEIRELKRIGDQRERFLNNKTNNAEQITLKTEDGIEIDTVKIKNNHSNKWIVYFCPNAACYEQLIFELKELSEKTGANVYTGNYRGVMCSKGTVESTQQMALDGKAMVQKLLSEGIPQEDILIHGHSIGGGVAVEVACYFPNVNLCIDRSFASFTHFLNAWVPFLGSVLGGIAGLAGWKFNSVENYNHVLGNKLIIYSKRDAIVLHKASLYKALHNKNIHPQALEITDVYNKEIFIENWKKENPQIKEPRAQTLAKREFDRTIGVIDHCNSLSQFEIYNEYLNFVKSALKLPQ